jgi:hypothetical protein
MLMARTAWLLNEDGNELTIILIDPTTRNVRETLYLRRSRPMTSADAQKFVDDNYPEDGSVKAAADALGLLTKRTS